MLALCARLERHFLGISDAEANYGDNTAPPALAAGPALLASMPAKWGQWVTRGGGDRFIVVVETRREGGEERPTLTIEATASAASGGFCSVRTNALYATGGGFRTIRQVEVFECPDAGFFWQVVDGAGARLEAFPSEARKGIGHYGCDGKGKGGPEFRSAEDAPPYGRCVVLVDLGGGGRRAEVVASLDPRSVCRVRLEDGADEEGVRMATWGAVRERLILLEMNLNEGPKAARLEDYCRRQGWEFSRGEGDYVVGHGGIWMVVYLLPPGAEDRCYATVDDDWEHHEIELGGDAPAELERLLWELIPPPMVGDDSTCA